MTKITKVTARGTATRKVELEPIKWSGDAFRDLQKQRLQKIPKNLTVHLGRGVRTTKAKNLPEPQARPSSYGMTRITGRGTSSRKSRNIGSKQ